MRFVRDGGVTALLEYCDVCDVGIVLEALGVSNSGQTYRKLQ